jgi:beta-glucosidase-like glycosyl hydrolase
VSKSVDIHTDFCLQMTGRAIGMEARAAMNAQYGYSTFWAPVVNLAREPRWGRNIEVPSEDPYHSGGERS